MTNLFVLGDSSPFNLLVAGDVEVEDCILDEGLEVEADVEGAGLSCWFSSFSRRCFKYTFLFTLESDLWCPVVVDSTCSVPQKN